VSLFALLFFFAREKSLDGVPFTGLFLLVLSPGCRGLAVVVDSKFLKFRLSLLVSISPQSGEKGLDHLKAFSNIEHIVQGPGQDLFSLIS